MTRMVRPRHESPDSGNGLEPAAELARGERPTSCGERTAVRLRSRMPAATGPASEPRSSQKRFHENIAVRPSQDDSRCSASRRPIDWACTDPPIAWLGPKPRSIVRRRVRSARLSCVGEPVRPTVPRPVQSAATYCNVLAPPVAVRAT